MTAEWDFPELALKIADAINDMRDAGFARPWPHRYRCIEPSPGTRLIVEVDDQLTITETPAKQMASRIVAWLSRNKFPAHYMTLRRAVEAVDIWLAVSHPIPAAEIKSVRWASGAGYTWHRLPWDCAEGECPTWDALLSRMTNREAFCAWLGSLFFDEAKQHQYIWCHGLGNDGKGAINRFLKRVFGRAYRSKQPPAPGDKFWTYGLIGARLVVFPDCNSQGFTTGGLFKSLSGGDPIDVEAKGRMSFTAELNCKFLFFSNERPTVTSEHADLRRIILCEFSEKGSKEKGFEERLWAEGGAFLSRCVKEYVSSYPDHGDIGADTDGITTWVSVVEEKFQSVFDAKFMQPHEAHRVHSGLSHLTRQQVDLLTVVPDDMLKILHEEFKDRKEQAAFRDWLYKKYGVQKRGIKLLGGDTTTFYRYIGICRRLSRTANNWARG